MAPCWICGSDETSEWKRGSIDRPLTAADLRITDDRYGSTLPLQRCHRCGFIFAAGGNLEALPLLYERLSDPAYFEGGDSRRRQMRWLVDTVLREHPGARTLLDIGAGSGLLVAEAQRRGLEATGIEPSREMAEHATRVEGQTVVLGLFPHPQLQDRRFDVITLVDVIEHVSEPVQLLRDCAAALNGNGILVVVTPDVASFAAHLMGTRWWHFRLAHVGYFSRRSLQLAAERAGLAPVRAFRPPWYFRVRYVADRLGRYLPIRRLNRVARRSRLLRSIYERVIPFNIRDSVGLMLRRSDDAG